MQNDDSNSDNGLVKGDYVHLTRRAFVRIVKENLSQEEGVIDALRYGTLGEIVTLKDTYVPFTDKKQIVPAAMVRYERPNKEPVFLWVKQSDLELPKEHAWVNLGPFRCAGLYYNTKNFIEREIALVVNAIVGCSGQQVRAFEIPVSQINLSHKLEVGKSFFLVVRKWVADNQFQGLAYSPEMMPSVGDVLVAHRREQNLSMNDLAVALGIDVSKYSEIENNRSNLSEADCDRLADIIGTDRRILQNLRKVIRNRE